MAVRISARSENLLTDIDMYPYYQLTRTACCKQTEVDNWNEGNEVRAAKNTIMSTKYYYLSQ
jgi:hypothetical protein